MAFQKIFISVPMNGKTDVEIAEAEQAVKNILYNNGYATHETIFYDGRGILKPLVPLNDVRLLGQSIAEMSGAGLVAFGEGWSEARGCRFEHDIATEYGMWTIDTTKAHPFISRVKCEALRQQQTVLNELNARVSKLEARKTCRNEAEHKKQLDKFACSNCHFESSVVVDKGWCWEGANFCPSCGARVIKD